MKRQNITLYFVLALGLAVIFGIYVSQRSLKETFKKENREKEEMQAQAPFRQLPNTARIIRKRGEFKEAKKEEPTLKEKETDLQQIPDDYVYTEEKVTSSDEGLEATGTPEIPEVSNLKKMPSASEFKELKSKGVIIY